uniref:Uncharacterized protein n=1 Tax=Ascaris lumbricoides TaxID=6252 RepID=A0A0M3HZ54_ASCLU
MSSEVRAEKADNKMAEQKHSIISCGPKRRKEDMLARAQTLPPTNLPACWFHEDEAPDPRARCQHRPHLIRRRVFDDKRSSDHRFSANGQLQPLLV